MVGPARRKPTALLVVTAWHEGATPRLAARITYTIDASQPGRVTVTAAGADEIVATVAGWLDEVEAAARRRDATVTDE
ncbi:MAG TPA: hypothetical protein VGQ15_10775 [Gaiellaceae bacterium]|jgi:hypothetical protein|nr:hypothetical protein [Gaiellaceae bacterium]